MAKNDKELSQSTDTQKPQRKYKTFSDIFGSGEFYPDLPKVPFKECLGKTFILYESKILRDFHTEYGVHDCGLMLMAEQEIPDNKFTTICSGQVVLERLEKAIKNRQLPALVTPQFVNGEYYNLI